jgi:2-polyprenyl-3-methyl-5-hydroxy-6-metoxy-1,4-benzoquinol methylase
MSAVADIECILCGTTWVPRHGAPIQPCTHCGIPTNVPPPARDVFTDELFFDGAYGGERLARTGQWLREARLRLVWVTRHVEPGRLLEIGSATGEFVSVAEQAGFDATGLEASAWAAQAAERLTASVVRADLVDYLAARPGDAYDAIAFFHVLEHVHDPRAFLVPLVAALAPQGRMFVEVPNGDARDLRDGGAWLGARLPDHVVHYRRSDLERLLSEVGLRIVEATTFTMKEFDSPVVWGLRRARWLTKARWRPSEDFLRVVAVRA